MSEGRRRRAGPIAGLVVILLVATACPGGGARRSSIHGGAPRFTDRPDEVIYPSPLSIEPPAGEPFDFCLGARDLQLRNASWLAFLAANQYAHFAELGPALEQLGFGEPGEGHRWASCARDLYVLRALESSDQLPEPLTAAVVDRWGDCARQWYRSRYLDSGAGRPAGVAAAFESHLIHEPWPDSSIQFFSAGRLSYRETRFSTSSTQAMWVRHGQMPLLILVFRGTEVQSLSDLRRDLDVRWTTLPGWGQVHRGFIEGVDSVEPELIRPRLAELEGTEVEVWITGHSLGAALATVMAARLLAAMDRGSTIRLAGLYTFGSPRVGDHDFAAAMEAAAARHGVALFRVRHGNDVVTRVPVSLTTVDGFEHVGRLVYLDHDGSLALEPDEVPAGIGRALADHSARAYYERLRAHAADPALARYTLCL